MRALPLREDFATSPCIPRYFWMLTQGMARAISVPRSLLPSARLLRAAPGQQHSSEQEVCSGGHCSRWPLGRDTSTPRLQNMVPASFLACF